MRVWLLGSRQHPQGKNAGYSGQGMCITKADDQRIKCIWYKGLRPEELLLLHLPGRQGKTSIQRNVHRTLLMLSNNTQVCLHKMVAEKQSNRPLKHTRREELPRST